MTEKEEREYKAWHVGKERKGSESLQAKRIALYTRFLQDFGKAIITKRMDPKQLTMMNLEISMVGSDLVVLAANKWQKLGLEAVQTGGKDMLPVLAQFAKVCLEMRKDLEPGTKLTALELLRVFVKGIDDQPRLLELLRPEGNKTINKKEEVK